ncbi:Amidohydrolase family protein [Rhodovastum atsumiense]|uniref:Amidohydrolase family protein n=1 Tax=Rhodovastum atsumiense TaxID=504468 RepID=A0A5M6J1T4_9PROT|nr:amidohydrolase family protein [Rhodovastum atsumiense]KAA5614566.1 amidohydrolase family protein [Rhodovastum atsumiense]CAH2599941.1 Amidohydrolase family protein [Rhodovastum atsumiense]
MASPLPPPLIDFHSHHLPARWPATTARGLPPAQAARWDRINARLADPAALVAHIDSGDLAARVVNIPAALFAAGDVVPLATWRALNDTLAELVATRPGQLIGLVAVDAFAGEEAAAEIERGVRQLGLRGVFVDSARGEALLDAPEARPALQAAATLGVPVFVHPVNPQPLTRQLARYPNLGTLLARGTVNAATLVALIEGEVFDTLPALKVVVTTLAIGGVLLARGYLGHAARPDALSLLRRHVHIDTMGFDPALIRIAVETLGIDNVLAGSDWPIVNDAPIRDRAAAAFAAAGLDEAAAAQVAAGNARRLLAIA